MTQNIRIEDTQSAKYVHEWVDSLAESVQQLASKSGIKLDFSRQSIEQLWDWLQPQLSLGAYFRSHEDPLEVAPETLPLWSRQPGQLINRKLASGQNLFLIGYLARYYGECIHRTIPQAQWVLWTWDEPHHAVEHEGEIALAVPIPQRIRVEGAFGTPVFPLSDLMVVVSRTLQQLESGNPTSMESTDLMKAYDLRVADLQATISWADTKLKKRSQE